MIYNEIIQKVGRKIIKKVYYYDNDIITYADINDIVSVKPSFSTQLIGTVMLGIELELKTYLPTDEKIYVEIEASYNGNKASKIYGPYYLKEIPLYNADTKTYTHQLYDGMLKSMVDYVPLAILFPCTIYEYFCKLIEDIGYVNGVESLPNGHLLMDNDIYIDIDFTKRNVLEDIAKANGVLFHIEENTIRIVSLDEETAIINDDILKNTNIEFGEHFGPINSIVLSRSADSDSIYILDEESVDINGLCEYKISNNQLMNNNNREEFLPAILNQLKGIEYDIFDTELVGYGGFVPLQKVEFQTGGNIYKSYVFNNEIEITQGYSEAIYTDMPEETTTDYKTSSTTDKLETMVYRIADKQNKKIEDIIQEVGKNSDRISSVKQTLDSIEQEVAAFYDFTKTVKGKNEIKLDDALDTNILKLTLNAENMQGGLFPSKNLFPSKKLFPRKAGATITIVVSRNSRYADKPLIFPSLNLFPSKKLFPRSNSEFRREFKFVLDKPLLEYNNVHDQLVVEFDQEKGTCVVKVLRKLKKENGVYIIYGQAKEEIIQELDFKLYKGVNYIYIKEYKNWNMEAEYIFNSELNKYYSTKVETSSKIKEMADEISLEVKQETDTDKLISKINMKPGQIDMTGLVTANENFKILQDGSIEAKNGSFSGNILLNDGSEIIGGKGLLSNLSFTGNGLIKTASLGTFYQVGYCRNNMNSTNYKSRIDIDAYIPDNFIIERAVVVISHFGLDVYYNGKSYGKGYSRNLNVFTSDMNSRILTYNMNSEYQDVDGSNLQKITGAMDNWTPDISNNKVDIKITSDIKNSLKNGMNRITIQSDGNIPNYNTSENSDYMQQGMIDYMKQTGMVSATLEVIGYTKPDKKGDEQANE